MILLYFILDVCVNEKGVHLGMDVLDGNLEAVEAPGFRQLNLVREPHCKVLVDDAVASSKESQDVGDEMALVVSEFLPVDCISSKVNLLNRPEAGHRLLVHHPDSIVVD